MSSRLSSNENVSSALSGLAFSVFLVFLLCFLSLPIILGLNPQPQSPLKMRKDLIGWYCVFYRECYHAEDIAAGRMRGLFLETVTCYKTIEACAEEASPVVEDGGGRSKGDEDLYYDKEGDYYQYEDHYHYWDSGCIDSGC